MRLLKSLENSSSISYSQAVGNITNSLLFIYIIDIIWPRLDKCIRLWSMQYANHGLYNFIREKKILSGEDFEERDEHLITLVNFFLTLKVYF